MRWWRALVVWLALAVAMVIQGAAREALLRPSLGELAAHQISSVTGSLIVLAGAWLALPWLDLVGSRRGQLQLGLAWLGLTVGFEFVFGHFVAGHDWAVLLHDYDLAAGRLWLLVLAATLAAPRLAGVVRSRRQPTL